MDVSEERRGERAGPVASTVPSEVFCGARWGPWEDSPETKVQDGSSFVTQRDSKDSHKPPHTGVEHF